MREIPVRIPAAWADPLLAAALLVICEADVIGATETAVTLGRSWRSQ